MRGLKHSFALVSIGRDDFAWGVVTGSGQKKVTLAIVGSTDRDAYPPGDSISVPASSIVDYVEPETGKADFILTAKHERLMAVVQVSGGKSPHFKVADIGGGKLRLSDIDVIRAG